MQGTTESVLANVRESMEVFRDNFQIFQAWEQELEKLIKNGIDVIKIPDMPLVINTSYFEKLHNQRIHVPPISLHLTSPELSKYVNEQFIMKGLNVNLNEYGGNLSMNEKYVDIFGETKFYKNWVRHLNGDTKVMVVSLEDYNTNGWNLEGFYFLPYFEQSKEYNKSFDTLLNQNEKDLFKGLGKKYLKIVLQHLMGMNDSTKMSTIITMGATDVTKNQKGGLLKLVEYYKSLNFEIDYDEYNRFMTENEYDVKVTPKTVGFEIENAGQSKRFMEYVPMISTFGKVIAS